MDSLLFPLLAITGPGYLGYAVPLIVVVSLVYAATRHEQMPAILCHAARIAAWIVAFMGGVFAVLWLLKWWVS